MAQVCTSHFALVMFGVVAPLRIKNTSSSLMYHPDLLGLHPESFTSFCSTPLPPPQTTCSANPERASLTGIRFHLRATSLEGQSGYLADPVPLTLPSAVESPLWLRGLSSRRLGFNLHSSNPFISHRVVVTIPNPLNGDKDTGYAG